MQLKPPTKKLPNEENLIPLINIVFLILIFFLVAATIRPFTAKDIKLASSQKHEKGLKVSFALLVNKAGEITFRGNTITLDALQSLGNNNQIFENNDAGTELTDKQTENSQATKSEAPILTLIADKDLPSEKLLNIVDHLNASNFKAIKLVTEIN